MTYEQAETIMRTLTCIGVLLCPICVAACKYLFKESYSAWVKATKERDAL